jgi:hydroxymethylbilane synthase
MTVKSENSNPSQTMPKKLVIGTRGSALAMWQAETVASRIANIGQDIDIQIKAIKTSGDWKPCQGEVRLDSAKGGKALFAKEIEEALLAGAIDMAVHSMKDLESVMPGGLIVPFMLPRSDARDAFLSTDPRVVHFNDLPQGAVVGTTSIRRQAFLLKQRPDVRIVAIRGNVDTRIKKLKAGQVDAMFLAIAGLERLGLAHEARCVLPLQEMLPSAGQGAIGLQIRESDLSIMSNIGRISCEKTVLCVKSERALLGSLGGGCHTPVGVYATLEYKESPKKAGDKWCGVLDITACVVSPDGKESWEQHMREHVLGLEEACAVGHSIGAHLKECVPSKILMYQA